MNVAEIARPWAKIVGVLEVGPIRDNDHYRRLSERLRATRHMGTTVIRHDGLIPRMNGAGTRPTRAGSAGTDRRGDARWPSRTDCGHPRRSHVPNNRKSLTSVLVLCHMPYITLHVRH